MPSHNSKKSAAVAAPKKLPAMKTKTAAMKKQPAMKKQAAMKKQSVTKKKTPAMKKAPVKKQPAMKIAPVKKGNAKAKKSQKPGSDREPQYVYLVQVTDNDEPDEESPVLCDMVSHLFVKLMVFLSSRRFASQNIGVEQRQNSLTQHNLQRSVISIAPHSVPANR